MGWPFLILLAVILDGVVLLSGRMGRGIRHRHGSVTRLAVAVCLNAVLVFGIVTGRTLPARVLAVDFLAAATCILLMPVPPNRRTRLPVLSWLPLSVLPLSLAFPAVPACAAGLGALLLLSRFILGRRRTAHVQSFANIHTYRRHLQETDRYHYEGLLSFLLLLTCACPDRPSVSVSLCVLAFLFYLLVDFRWCYGSVFFLVPDLDMEVAHAVSVRNRQEAEEPLLLDRTLYDRCCRYMAERRPYLVESFSLMDLSNALYTNKVYLSKTINEYSHKNFRQWVNHYRIQYAMDLFRKNMSLKVTELATLSGFRSATTFNMAFRIIMDESPGAWCKNLRFHSLLGEPAPSEKPD